MSLVSNVVPVQIISASSTLAVACAGLSSNQSVSFTNQSAMNGAALAWQAAFYHDAVNGRIHLTGKPANADAAWSYQYYNIATDSWVSGGSLGWSHSGHIYGNFTMDYDTGDLYQGVGSYYLGLHRYRLSSGWDVISDMFISGRNNEIPNGGAFHPNLFGAGQPGVVYDNELDHNFWNKTTGVVTHTAHGGQLYGKKEGEGVYWPAKDAVYVGSGDANSPGGTAGGYIAKIAPGPVVTQVANKPPIRWHGGSHLDGSGLGSIHVHPGNPDKLLLLETAGSRAWTTTDMATWTQVGNHPFTVAPRVLCSLRANLGCMWAVGRTDGGGEIQYSALWRPPV